MLVNYYCSEELAIYASFIRDTLFVMSIKLLPQEWFKSIKDWPVQGLEVCSVLCEKVSSVTLGSRAVPGSVYGCLS